MPSWVWNHMRKEGLTKDGRQPVKCNYCNQSIKPQKKGNTSNLAAHLGRHHKEKLSPEELRSTSGKRAVNNEVPTQLSPTSCSEDHSLQENLSPADSEQSREGSSEWDVPIPVVQLTEGSVHVPSEDEGSTVSQFYQPDATSSPLLPPMEDCTHGGNFLSLVDDGEAEGSCGYFTKTEGLNPCGEVDKYTGLPASKMFEQLAVPAIPVQHVYHATTSYSTPVNASFSPKMLAQATTYGQLGETNKEGQDLLPQDATHTDKPVDELTEAMCVIYANMNALPSGQNMTTFNDAAMPENADTSSPDDDENDDLASEDCDASVPTTVGEVSKDDDLASDDSEASVPTTVGEVSKKYGRNGMQQPKDDVEKGSHFRYNIPCIDNLHEQLDLTRVPRHPQLPSGDRCRFSGRKHNTLYSNVREAKDGTALHCWMAQPTPVMPCGGQVPSPSGVYGAVGYRPTHQGYKEDKRKKRKQTANEGTSAKSMRVNPGIQGGVGPPGSCQTDVRYPPSSIDTTTACFGSSPGHSRHTSSPSLEMVVNNRENRSLPPVTCDVPWGPQYWGNTLGGSQCSPNLPLDSLHISPQPNLPLEQPSVQCVDQLPILNFDDVNQVLNGNLN